MKALLVLDVQKGYIEKYDKGLLATEFVCQGLEFNTSELFWGGDFVVHNGAWRIHPIKNTNALNKPFKIYTLFYCRGDALA